MPMWLKFKSFDVLAPFNFLSFLSKNAGYYKVKTNKGQGKNRERKLVREKKKQQVTMELLGLGFVVGRSDFLFLLFMPESCCFAAVT